MAIAFVKDNGDVLVQTVLIANGAQVSDEIAVPQGMCITRVQVPASFDGGNISFTECAVSGGTFVDLYDCGDASTAAAKLIINTPGASKSFAINPTLLIGGLGFAKIATASAVGADRTLQIVLQRTTL